MELNRANRSRLIILTTLLLLLSGCSTTNPYHFIGWQEHNCSNPDSSDCRQSYYQEYPGYDLAFVEYTERGNTFNDAWKDEVVAKIAEREKAQGVVTLVFIHGWKHNADEDNKNLKKFKKTLEELTESAQLLGRRLVGVYIGWRGLSVTIPLLKELSFWDRKAVAQEVGKGGVTNLLLDLEKIDRNRSDNVLLIVGHSFGGAIAVSATSEIISEILINDRQQEDPGGSVGDAVIVLNPAIEANQSLSMVEAALQNGPTAPRNPLFYSISTDADRATHYAFPIGQTLGLFFSWRQTDLERANYYDRITNEKLMLREEHLDSTTIGNFAPYLTHRLSMDDSGGIPNARLHSCEEDADACVPKGLTTLEGHPALGPLPAHYPLQFIKTDKSIMEDHNDIFNPRILTFIYTLIDDIVRYTVREDPKYEDDGIATGNILSRPDDLNRRFRQFYDNIEMKLSETPATGTKPKASQ
ncbi:MAG: hypothetical protein ABW098_06720 [Candidatus Thiodiazotropha sp.]